MTSPLTPKERVLEKYPEPEVQSYTEGPDTRIAIWAEFGSLDLLGTGPTESAAWEAAANQLEGK